MKREAWLAQVEKEQCLSARDLSLLDRASRILLGNVVTSEDPRWGGLRGITPSHLKFKGLWNWDSAFIGRTVSRWDTELAEEQFRIFLNLQAENGQFPDVIRYNGEVMDGYSKPPVFAWALWEVYRRSGNLPLLATAYEAYKRNEQWWCLYRRGRGEELFHYDCNQPGHDRARTFIGWESGWDNAVRWDTYPSDLFAIDLCCYMVLFYEALAEMAKCLQKPKEQALWLAKKERLATLINRQMYDEAGGYYADTNRYSGRVDRVLTPASFMPLYCGIATEDRAAAMNKLAIDHFLPGMPTVAYTDPSFTETEYWRGPTWLNVAYFAAKGLKRYGFAKTADTVKETILHWCAGHDTFYENYNPRTGEGLFGGDFSWSSAFVIEFILDF